MSSARKAQGASSDAVAEQQRQEIESLRVEAAQAGWGLFVECVAKGSCFKVGSRVFAARLGAWSPLAMRGRERPRVFAMAVVWGSAVRSVSGGGFARQAGVGNAGSGSEVGVSRGRGGEWCILTLLDVRFAW